jgi:hypothetical protein
MVWIAGVYGLYLVVAFVASDLVIFPSLSRATMYQNEVAAIGVIREIQIAQTHNHSRFNHYAESLGELGPLASDLTSGSKRRGYSFAMAGSPTGYTVTAAPNVFNSTGSRTFYSDQSRVIHERYGPEPATIKDPALK